MAYQSKHSGTTIDTNIDIVPDLQTQINELNTLINNLNNSILTINTNITNLQSEDTSIQASINTINSEITMLQANTGMTTSSQYVRFNNGLQICWGRMSYPQLAAKSTGSVTVTLPAAFKDTNYQIATTMEVDAGNSWHTGIFAVGKATSYMVVSTRNGESTQLSSANGIWSYIAIGYWK